MKKLMIAAAMVCATAFSQAATCSWTVNTSGTLSNPAGVTLTSDISTPMMYVFMTTATAASERSTLLAALKTAAAGGDATTALSGAWQSVNLSSGAYAATEYITDSTAGTKYSFYGIILGADAAGNQYAYFTATATGNAIEKTDGTTSVELDGGITDLKAFSTTNAKNGAWYTIAEAADPVPEPTSGLLLLLGVAGLALRRKQK